MLVIRFTNDTDMDQAMTDLRDKVAQVKSQLPDDASDPTVMSIDIDSMPVVSVALRGNDLASLQSIAEDEIQPALERLDGVASVDISGGYEQEIAVHTDASRLKGYNLTISSIGQQLVTKRLAPCREEIQGIRLIVNGADAANLRCAVFIYGGKGQHSAELQFFQTDLCAHFAAPPIRITRPSFLGFGVGWLSPSLA